MLFREFAADDDAAIAEGGGADFEGFSDAVGGFEEGEGEGGFGEGGEDFAASPGLRGRNPRNANRWA